MADARAKKRFPVKLPIRIVEAESAEEHQGITANASAMGVYIRTEASRRRKPGEWRAGAKVDFEMTLPASVIGADKDVVVHCQGRVVRVDRVAAGPGGEKSKGMACVIEKYEFSRKS